MSLKTYWAIVLMNKANGLHYTLLILKNTKIFNTNKNFIKATEETARLTIDKIQRISEAMMEVKHLLRNRYPFYSQDLLNHLFSHPYTRIDYAQAALGLKSRQTAASYLNQLSADAVLIKREGRPNYYINPHILKVLAHD